MTRASYSRMKKVGCPQHGEIVLDLARGLISPSRAVHVEQIRVECEQCSAWWAVELDSRNFPKIDASVEETLRAFVPPQRQRRVRKDYLVAAATVALAAGILLFASDTSVSRRGGEIADQAVVGLSGQSSAVFVEPDLILSEGFETHIEGRGLIVQVGLEAEGAGDDLHPSTEERSPDTIFRSGLEVGGLEAWNDHS